MDEKVVAEQIDLRGTICPLNYMKIRTKLSGMKPGNCLEAVIDLGDSSNDLPKKIKLDGHRILGATKIGETLVLTIEKGE